MCLDKLITKAKVVIKEPLVKYIIFFLIGLILVICIEVFLFPGSSHSVEFKNVEIPTIFNFLATLLFIAWLVESFLEIIIKIFQIDSKVEQFTAITGMSICLLIAWSGVNTVGNFFVVDSQAEPRQKLLFGLIDLILTAGVIAGGSKGIHELTNAYKGIMQVIQNQPIDKPEKSSSPLVPAEPVLAHKEQPQV